MSFIFSKLEDEYTALIGSMRVKPDWVSIINRKASEISKNKKIYEEISKKTNGIPWELIAVIHNLECGGSFNKHLHNGDPLTGRTYRVPKGYPKSGSPPFTFEESAIDALELKNLHKISDWSIERICYTLELFNGFGYRYRKINSPYLWSGTYHYNKGKFVADSVYDSQAVSKQIGAIPLFFALRNGSVSSVDNEQNEIKESTKGAEVKPVFTTKEVVTQSKKLSFLMRVRLWLSTGMVSVFTVDTLNLASEWMDKLKQFASDNIFPIAVFGVLSFIAITKFVEKKSVDDANEGRYIPSGYKGDL